MPWGFCHTENGLWPLLTVIYYIDQKQPESVEIRIHVPCLVIAWLFAFIYFRWSWGTSWMSWDGLWLILRFAEGGSEADGEGAAALKTLWGTICEALEDTVTPNPPSSSWGTSPRALLPGHSAGHWAHLLTKWRVTLLSLTCIRFFPLSVAKMSVDNFIWDDCTPQFFLLLFLYVNKELIILKGNEMTLYVYVNSPLSV